MKEIVHWPSWRYGPNGQSAIFHKAEDVPVGWYPPEERHLIVEPEAEKPEDGPDAHGGYHKSTLIQMLRKTGEKVHANSTAKKMHEKLVALGVIPKEDDKPPKEE